jgi:hypothetical protein
VQGNLRPASDVEITRLLGNPNEITRFLFGAEAAQRERVDLDRAWHAIHFALNGSRLDGQPPLNFLVDVGTPVGDVDVGYGPARVLTSQQVRQLAQALAPVDPETLRGRVDVRQLEEMAIYPGAWHGNGLDVEYVVARYATMRELVTRLARDGLGMILYIN